MSPIIPRKMDTFRTFYDFGGLKRIFKMKGPDSPLDWFQQWGIHEGHLSLVKKANVENDVVVVTIFVNPKQFNNQTDLKKYQERLKKI